MLKRIWDKYREILMYLLMGGCTTIVNWLSYSLCALAVHPSFKLFGVPGEVFIANIVSWICATVFAFITNKLLVFHSYDRTVRTVLREAGMFFSARLITGGMEVVLVPALIRLGLDQAWFGVEGILSKVVASIIAVILNYIVSKLLIFKKDESTEE